MPVRVGNVRESGGAVSMRRLSSSATFLQKRVFPAVWFGLVAALVCVGAYGMASGGGGVAGVLAPLVMAGIGWVVCKQLVFDLVDEVWDAGEELVVRNAGTETRVALGDIVNVGYAVVANPQRVTLLLRQPSALGSEITFAAPTSWLPFARSPVVDELIERVDAARRVG